MGDYIVAGTAWGRVKALSNDRGRVVKEVEPGAPAEVLGFGSLPEAGDLMAVFPNERLARSTATDRERLKATQQSQSRALTLEEVVKQIDAGDIKELNLVLKADVQGSVEAVRQSLERLTEAEARVRILHAGSGNVTESDVLLASASNAIIVGFAVGNALGVERVAERMGVEIRHYNIIYQMIEDIEQALHGMLEPSYTEVIVGQAEVRGDFPRPPQCENRRLPGHRRPHPPRHQHPGCGARIRPCTKPSLAACVISGMKSTKSPTAWTAVSSWKALTILRLATSCKPTARNGGNARAGQAIGIHCQISCIRSS